MARLANESTSKPLSTSRDQGATRADLSLQSPLPHCYTDPYNSKEFFPRELTLDEIHRLLNEMQEIGIVWLNLTGGDIFMAPAVLRNLRGRYRKGFLLQLYTNGTLFTKATVKRLQADATLCHRYLLPFREEGIVRLVHAIPGSFRAFVRGLEMLIHSRLPFTLKTKAMNWNRGRDTGHQAIRGILRKEFGFTNLALASAQRRSCRHSPIGSLRKTSWQCVETKQQEDRDEEPLRQPQ